MNGSTLSGWLVWAIVITSMSRAFAAIPSNFHLAAAAAGTPAAPSAAPAGASSTGMASSPDGAVPVLQIDGAIGPATARYVARGIAAAGKGDAPLIVLQIDTPGGLDVSMRDIIRAILASPVPVVSYVSPSGARAASAGTYILYASHVAAMAPTTNLGAATPVAVGADSNPDGSKSQTALEHKVVNDAVAYIRGLAELRGRNAQWAEQAVRGAASLPATSAVQQQVVDLIARDLPDLLAQIDGREVRMGQRTVKLATRHLHTVKAEMDWRTEFLAVITNPSIAYGLMLIGIYGLLLEGYNPGVVLPGVVGVICLLVALFAFQILSVNYAGLALVAVGTGLIVAEFFVPTFGSLGLGGLTAFVVGSLILFDTDVPGMNIALPLILAIATVGGLLVAGIAWLAARSRQHRVVTGVQGMVGGSGEVVDSFTDQGIVRFGGELWNARSTVPLQKGAPVRIARVEGLTVWVEPL